MTHEAFAALLLSCGIALPPSITVDRLSAIARVESGRNPSAVSPPNRDGSRDYGLMQLNAQWIGKPGFPRTVAEALEPCPNIAAGVRILADADRQAACIYNTGRPACRNGYDAKIVAASARLVRAERPPAPAPQPRPESWDVFAEHAPEAEPETPDGEDDAAPSGQPPRVIVELP